MTYLLLFLFKKIKTPIFKQGLAFLGNYSFAIMGLHLLCFKPCILIWNKCFHTSFDVAALVPEIGMQYVAGIAFLLFSCFVPAVLGYVVENKLLNYFDKNILRSICKSKRSLSES